MHPPGEHDDCCDYKAEDGNTTVRYAINVRLEGTEFQDVKRLTIEISESSVFVIHNQGRGKLRYGKW